MLTTSDLDLVAREPPTTQGDAQPHPIRLSLLDVLPAMEEAVPPEDRELARRVLLVPARTFEPGTLTLPPFASVRPFAVVIVSGLVLRGTSLGDRPVGELLGPSDVIDTQGDEDDSMLPSRTELVVRERTTVAMLEERFVLAARRWPGLFQVVSAQQARQARRASRHLAALGLPRVEDRVTALFCDLADRWGRVTPDGIRIDLPLTHALIGQIVGARRPTVSLALGDLAERGRLRRDEDQSWLLAPDVRMAA